MINNSQIVIRLIFSALAGGIVGLEREVKNRPAGLRTHVLVSLGSALVMLISIDGFNGVGDPARLAAQVVTGVGFLGAGTIMKTGSDIKGLTTAASLWVCSGIGLAIGNGYYLGGAVTTIIVIVALISLRTFEGRMSNKKTKSLGVIGKNRPGLIGDIGIFLGKHNISIKDIEIMDDESDSDEEDSEIMEVYFSVRSYNNINLKYIYSMIYEIPGVIKVIYEDKELFENYSDDSWSNKLNED